MRTIDLEHWPRREHVSRYRDFGHPYFGLTAPVDVTALRHEVRARGLSFTLAVTYLITRAANRVPEFRQRLRDDLVVEHDLVHPSITVLGRDDVFGFCILSYGEEFSAFQSMGRAAMARVAADPSLSDPPGRDDLLFMTAIPWVSFTAFQHPHDLRAPDSVPRFAWGRFTGPEDALTMPLNVTVHHALVDGLHVGRLFGALEDLLAHPSEWLTQAGAANAGSRL